MNMWEHQYQTYGTSTKFPFVLTIVTLVLTSIRPVCGNTDPTIHHHISIDQAVTANIRQSNISKKNGIQLWRENHMTNGFFLTIPALTHRKRKRRVHDASTYDDDDDENSFYKLIKDKATSIQEVAVKTKKVLKDRRKLSDHFKVTTQQSYDFLLGITPQTLHSSLLSSTSKQNHNKKTTRRIDLQEGMSEALDELRSLRKQMEDMQREIITLKQLQLGIDIVIPETTLDLESKTERNQKRIREYEAIAKDVERWAESILFPSSSSSSSTTADHDDNIDERHDGWVEIPCHAMFKSKWNRNGMTRAYLKYMKDSRPTSNNNDSGNNNRSVTKSNKNVDTTTSSHELLADSEWPCLRLYSIIDAPCAEVCTYLSQERHVPEYNQLLDRYQDLDVITSHSKICYASSPQLLFIKPRDLITFCSHRWKRDGTQIVINQACDQYHDRKATAFALRGATYISPDPNDPDHKTQIAMLAHASPGTDLPKWACRTAIQSLLPIEPYRLFYKINEGIKQCRPELQALIHQRQQDVSARIDDSINDDDSTKMTEMVGNNTGSRFNKISRAPAGLAQMGYACFWPNGGGTIYDNDDGYNVSSITREFPVPSSQQLPVMDTNNDTGNTVIDNNIND